MEVTAAAISVSHGPSLCFPSSASQVLPGIVKTTNQETCPIRLREEKLQSQFSEWFGRSFKPILNVQGKRYSTVAGLINTTSPQSCIIRFPYLLCPVPADQQIWCFAITTNIIFVLAKHCRFLRLLWAVSSLRYYSVPSDDSSCLASR